MLDTRLAPYGVLLLRVTLGVMFLAHSLVLKLVMMSLSGNAAFFAAQGFPEWLGYAVFWAEVIGGFALVLGIQARWAALALSPILIGAVWVHSGNGWVFLAENGGWEYPLYLTVATIAQAMLGDGPCALSPSRWPLYARARG